MSWIISPQYKDPSYSSVSLLLHGNGSNGSTIITDNSPTPKTVTAFGNAQISTAQSKFGGSSIAFDGTGDWLATQSSNDFAFGSGNYTIECWIYPTTTTTRRIVRFAGDADNVDLNIGAAGTISYYNGTASAVSAAGALSANQWSHIALVRLAGTARVYVNGGVVLTQATTPTTALPRILYIGGVTDFLFQGYIDELRITKGVARYTSNFTPPTAPFPDI